MYNDPTMTQQTIGTAFITIGFFLIGLGAGIRYANSRRVVVYPTSKPTFYDIALECQRLSAQTIDKSRIQDEKQVVFTYKSCVEKLLKAAQKTNINDANFL